jgi:hypothetical protein
MIKINQNPTKIPTIPDQESLNFGFGPTKIKRTVGSKYSANRSEFRYLLTQGYTSAKTD